MGYTPVIFTDLDDTIFVSGEHYSGRDLNTLHLSSKQGRFSESYMCERRESILTWLGTGATIIPVTAREWDSYNDVQIPFTDGAIVANGTIIIGPDGKEDQAWKEKMETVLLQAREALNDVEKALKSFDKTGSLFQIDWYWSGRHAYGMTAKVLDTTIPQHDIEQNLHQTIQNEGLYTFVRPSWVGNYLGFMPNGIGKAPAVQYLMNTRDDIKDRPTIGMGDASTDLDFMALCDMMVIPKDTNNSKKLLS